MSRNCFYSIDGRVNHFSCSLAQQCCDSECCSSDFKFYTHWYFWLAVAVLVMFVIAAVISGYCRHRRRPPPYRTLNTAAGDPQPAFIPWAWALDEDSGISSPRDFQRGNTPRPFLYPYGPQSASSHTVDTEVADETVVK